MRCVAQRGYKSSLKGRELEEKASMFRMILLSLPHPKPLTRPASPIHCCLYMANSSWNHNIALFIFLGGGVGGK